MALIKPQSVLVTIYNQGKYYRELGYGDCKQREQIWVDIDDLMPSCKTEVKCECDNCGVVFERSYQVVKQRIVDELLCKDCSYKSRKGKPKYNLRGDKHPRFKPHSQYEEMYAKSVTNLSRNNYKLYKEIINPDDLPLGRTGDENSYQVDHILSVSEGRDRRIDYRIISHPCNLRMLSWKENLDKRDRSDQTLEELMEKIEASGIDPYSFSDMSIDDLISETPEERKERLREYTSRGGKKGGAKSRELGLGFCGFDAEARRNNAINASNVQRERGQGFFNKEKIAVWSRKGGAASVESQRLSKNGSKMYNDGIKSYRYGADRMEQQSFEDFLKENPDFKPGRLPNTNKDNSLFVWYNDGTRNYRYYAKRQRELPIEEFLNLNPQYKWGLLKKSHSTTNP